jgi:hypothetical protein
VSPQTLEVFNVAKRTKTQLKRLMTDIRSKAHMLFLHDLLTLQQMEQIRKINVSVHNKLKK